MSLTFDKYLAQSHKRPGHYTWLARIPFLIFALGGMLGLLTLKWYEIDQILVSGVAIALIVVYAIIVAWTPHLRIREDQLGDNCYYLGFLYTLISLAWALWKFAQFQKIEEIIANFGLALASTIVGILLRVVINQARKDVLETEQDARMMLTESMVNMRVQLNDAVIAMRAFCAQAQQITSDAIRDNAERANTALEQSVAKIGDTSEIVLKRIEQAFDEFNENSRKLNQVAGGTVKALETLIDRLEAMEPPSDLISKRIEGVMSSAEKAGSLLRERLEQDEQAIREASARMKDMEEQLKAAASWISAAGSGLAGVTEAARTSASAAQGASQKLVSLTQSLSASLVEQERAIASARASSTDQASSLLEVQKKLADEARQSLETLFGALKNHNDAMAAELERTRRMTADTGTALADMTDVLTQRVRDMRAGRPDAAE